MDHTDFQMDPTNYHIMYWKEKSLLTIVGLSYHDYRDHQHTQFLKDADGERMQWDKKDEAIKYLNAHFKPEHIDPEFITPNNPAFLKREIDLDAFRHGN